MDYPGDFLSFNLEEDVSSKVLSMRYEYTLIDEVSNTDESKKL